MKEPLKLRTEITVETISVTRIRFGNTTDRIYCTECGKTISPRYRDDGPNRPALDAAEQVGRATAQK